MNGAFYIGAVGLRSQQRALDVTASNIANANTPAYKRAQVRFSEIVASSGDADVPRADLRRNTDAGVTVDAMPMTNIAGEIRKTGDAMDLAIDGQGFVELMGPGGQAMLWRGGALKIGDDGLLSAANGLALKAAITVPDDASDLSIGADGIVRARVGDQADPVEIGQMTLVKVADASAIEALDGGLYRVGDGARVIDVQPGEDGAGTFVQGGIEQSNVEMTTEMVEVMLAQRAYAANAQILQAADQMMSIANSLRR